MRKDVKIIMAICVIVLVGLIVYALFLPGQKKSPVANNENAAENSANAPAENGGESATTQPAETNVTAIEPTTQPGETAATAAPATTPPAMAMSGNSAIAPTPAPAAAPASGDWNKLLETGSATPDASSSMSGAATPSASAMNTGTNAAGVGTASMMATSSTPMPEPAANSSSENSTTAAPNTAAGQRTYVIKSGDTPSSIAQAEYGNRSLYTKILAANPKLNARHMRVGQKIILPELSAASSTHEKAGRNSAAVEDMNGGATENASGSSATSAAEPGSRYTVVSGDSLQRIATKVYGSSAQWQKIYDLNRSKIGSNPAHLRVGMVLMLPKGRTKAASSTETPTATPAESADTNAAPMNTPSSETIPVTGNSAAR